MKPVRNRISNGLKSPRVVAIVPAAGCGRRLGTKEKKPFVLLDGKPLVSYALKALNNCSAVDGIIAASGRSSILRLKDIAKRFKIYKLIGVVAGGATRSESVSNCMKRLGSSCEIVLIHDAARPLIDEVTIERAIKAASRFGACVVAVPESDTVKLSGMDLFVKETIDRKKIFRAQTPQAFRLDVIRKAYGSGACPKGFTDDAGIVEAMGVRVKIVEGSYRNLKVTTREDLKIAEALL